MKENNTSHLISIFLDIILLIIVWKNIHWSAALAITLLIISCECQSIINDKVLKILNLKK